MWFYDWVVRHKDFIGAAISVIGVIFGLSGLAYTAIQFRDNAAAQEAQTAYAIQKDARTLMHLFHDPKFNQYLQQKHDGLTEEEKLKYRWYVSEVFQFYFSVFLQAERNTLDERFVKLLTSEFCSFTKAPAVRTALDAAASDSFLRTQMNQCK